GVTGPYELGIDNISAVNTEDVPAGAAHVHVPMELLTGILVKTWVQKNLQHWDPNIDEIITNPIGLTLTWQMQSMSRFGLVWGWLNLNLNLYLEFGSGLVTVVFISINNVGIFACEEASPDFGDFLHHAGLGQAAAAGGKA
ncbi:hypothetical protein B0H21DRAFT_714512, partial [Amylocystis lapponica]